MSGGTVRAEEFNSILEGAFPIAQAAANAIDGAAGSVGRLRQMVIAGEISSKEFFDAIISQTTELEAAFANTIPTVSQAFTVLGNNFTLFIGQMDGAYGASGAVAKAIIALAENIDRVAIYAGTAALAIGGAYVTSAAIAAASTLTFAGALTFLRAAIMRIGIGLFVVAIGEGVYWFNKLVTATGGWGFALQALGDLAAGVWEGIKTSASSIGPSLNAVWETVKSGFYSMLAGLTEMWSGFLGSMAGGLAGIPGFGGISDSLSAASANAFGSMSEYTAKAQAATSANERLTASAAALREQGWDRVNAALKTLQLQMDGANGELDEGTKASDKLKDALGEVNNALGEKGVAGGAGKAEEAVKDLKTEMEGPLSGAIDNLGNAFGEFLTGGIRSFKDFAKSIIDGFKRMISQMIATSIANPIKLALGLSVGGGAGTSAAAGGVAAGGAGGGGGILGGLLGGKVFGAGGVIGGLFKGFTTGITNMFGGFGTMFSGIGSQLGLAATGSMSAIAGAIGMIAAPLLAVAAVFSFFKTKTTELDAGLRVTVTGMDALIETFSTIEKKKFWGLSKKVSTGYSPADDAVADPLIRAVADIQGGVLVAAKTMGIGSDAFTKFSHTLQVSTKGLSEEDAQKAVEDAFGDLGNAFAGMIPGLQRYTRAGEESLAAVTRLSAALVTANDAFDLLGRNLYAATLAGADMASGLVDAFGGLDAMTSAVGTYWEAFYSEAERSDTIMRRLRDQFADLNVVMPESRAEYRKIVDAIDTTTEAGRELFAGMVSLAGAMDAVLPQVASFTAAMQGIVDRIGGEIGVQIDQATQMAADYKASASLWYKAATTIRDFLRDLNNSPLALGSASQQFATNKGRFDTAFGMVKGGDLQAAQDMPALAKAYLESIQATSGSAVDYRRQAAQVTAALQLAGGISDVEGSNDDILRGLYQQQIDVLTSLANFLQLDGIDADLLKTFDAETQELIKNFDGTVGLFDTTLKQISDAITSAKDFSYDKIMADLDIAINLGKGSKLPAWVKDLVTGAGGNIKTTFDFILRRDDLTPDMKWIATQSISDMTKNLKFIVTKGLDEATAALALMVTSSLTKTIKFIVRSPLDDETKRLALIGNSNLVRTVKAVLSSNADPDAMILALAATGAYDVAVRAALDPSVTKNVRQLVFGDTGTFEAVVTAALSLDKAARRILLTQAGEYAVNITATLVSGLDKPIQKLLLNANTMAIRAVTIAAAFADGMDPELVTLLAEDGSRAIRTIKAVVNPGGIDALGLLFLDQLIQTAPVERSITASVGAMSAGNRRVLFEQKGAYAVDISASLGAGVKGSIKPLLFDKPTAIGHWAWDIGITGGSATDWPAGSNGFCRATPLAAGISAFSEISATDWPESSRPC
ncbi:MAG: hypothetical protein IPL79_20395 [Myxococcales bacterium]|nr:hypothetical protein [Myxococcales bacterium]